jgi:hypothetical protein
MAGEVYFTAIKLSAGGTGVQHISSVWWLDSGNGASNTMTTPQAIEWIRQGHSAYVGGPNGRVLVEVVAANPPYLRTQRDNTTKDNLLSLPRF